MLLTAKNSIVAPKKLDIRVLNEWDERIATDILIPSSEPWEIEVTKKRTKQDGTYFFVGYLDGKAIVYSDIHKSEYGNTRFDYIVTAVEVNSDIHRRKSYNRCCNHSDIYDIWSVTVIGEMFKRAKEDV